LPRRCSRPVRRRQRRGGSRELTNGLIAAAVRGDRRARDELLALIQPLVLRYCRARLGRQESVLGSADDVAQEVCLAVVSALGRYQPAGLSFRAFVYGIAVPPARRRGIGRVTPRPFTIARRWMSALPLISTTPRSSPRCAECRSAWAKWPSLIEPGVSDVHGGCGEGGDQRVTANDREGDAASGFRTSSNLPTAKAGSPSGSSTPSRRWLAGACCGSWSASRGSRRCREVRALRAKQWG
jgi:hypothetical protein